MAQVTIKNTHNIIHSLNHDINTLADKVEMLVTIEDMYTDIIRKKFANLEPGVSELVEHYIEEDSERIRNNRSCFDKLRNKKVPVGDDLYDHRYARRCVLDRRIIEIPNGADFFYITQWNTLVKFERRMHNTIVHASGGVRLLQDKKELKHSLDNDGEVTMEMYTYTRLFNDNSAEVLIDKCIDLLRDFVDENQYQIKGNSNDA